MRPNRATARAPTLALISLVELPEFFVDVAVECAGVVMEVPEAVVRIVGMVSVWELDVTDETNIVLVGDALVSVARVLPVVADGSEPVMLLGRSVCVGGSVGAAAAVASPEPGSVGVAC